MDFPLIVVPDPSARARKHSPDREQVTHAPWLEDPALQVHEGDALTVEDETGAQLLLREVIMHSAQEPDTLEGGEAHQDVGVVGAHAGDFDFGEGSLGRKLTGNGSFRFVKKENACVSRHLDLQLGVRLGVDGVF